MEPNKCNQINGTNNNSNIFSSLNQGNYTIIATDDIIASTADVLPYIGR